MERAAFVIDCRRCATMDALLYELAEVLSLPDLLFFGNRWDALADCLLDLRQIGADSIVIRFDGFAEMYSRLPPDERDEAEALLQTLQFVAAHCRKSVPARKTLQFIIQPQNE